MSTKPSSFKPSASVEEYWKRVEEDPHVRIILRDKLAAADAAKSAAAAKSRSVAVKKAAKAGKKA